MKRFVASPINTIGPPQSGQLLNRQQMPKSSEQSPGAFCGCFGVRIRTRGTLRAGASDDWYGAAETAVEGDQRTVAAGVLGLLQGDAGTRAILAWHMGWEPAQTASRADWMAPFLARALDDPYDAVRHIGSRSLARLPGFVNFQYDYLAPPAERRRAVGRAMQLWKLPSDTPWRSDGDRVLILPDGTLRSDEVERLLDSRDHRPIYLVE